MAQLALGVVGGVIGSYFGPVGAQIGFAIGSGIGGLLFPAKGPTIEGPRLRDTAVQTSTDGAPIPDIFATMRIAGNVFWATEIRETRNEEDVGGKGGMGGGGGGTQVTYSYSVSLAIGLCEGEITGIRRIWADSKLIYSIASGATPATFKVNTSRGEFTVYTGSETQTQDPTIAADKTAANTPAFRGLAYVVFTNFQLADFANHIPNFEFEVVKSGAETYPAYRHVVSSVTFNSLAVDERRNRAVYAEQIPSAGDFIYTWDFTSTAPQAFGEISTGHGINDDDAVVMVDAAADEYYLIWGASNGTSGLTWQTFDASTGARKADKNIADINLFGPWANVNGSFESVVNPTGWVWSDAGNYALGMATGFSSGDTFIIKFRPSTEYISLEVLGPQTETERVLPDQPLIDADGGIWFLGADVYQRVDPNPLYVAAANTLAKENAFLWKARQEIWVELSAGSEWAVFDIATETESAGTSLIASVGSYTTGIENSLGQAWFFKASGTAGYLDAILVNSDLSIEKTLTAFWAAADGIDTSYRSVPGVIFANRLANAQAFYEYALEPGTVALSTIVDSLCNDVNIDDADVTDLVSTSVRGYGRMRTMTARAAIEPLALAFGVDAVESNGVPKFVLKGGASVETFSEDDMGAHTDINADGPETWTVTRRLETELPNEMTILYSDQTTDYLPAAARIQRLTGYAEQKIFTELPIVFTSAEAHQKVGNLMTQSWLEDAYSFELGPEYLGLDPTDVVTLPDESRIRITKTVQQANGVIKVDAVGDDDGALTSYEVGNLDQTDGQITLSDGGPTNLAVLDCCLLRDVDSDTSWYLGACGETTDWPGAIIYKSIDGGSSYGNVAGLSTAAKIGTVQSGLMVAQNDCGQWDHASKIVIKLAQPDLTLSSASSIAAFYNGENGFLISQNGTDWELAQVYTVTDNGDGSWTLQDMLRGRKGTEHNAGPFTSGARIVFVDSTRISRVDASLSEIDSTSIWKGVTYGWNLADEVGRQQTYGAVAAKPISPVNIGGGYLPNGDISITWTRRARHDQDWRSGGGQTLDEPSEEYDIEIWDQGYGRLYRTLSVVGATTVTYTAAMRSEDHGSPEIDRYVAVRIYQLSTRVGRGFAGEALVGDVPIPCEWDRSLTTSGFTRNYDHRGVDSATSIQPWAPTSRGFASGKWYLEIAITCTTITNVFYGISSKTTYANSDSTNTTLVRMWRGSGILASGGVAGSITFPLDGSGATNIVMFAWDASNGKIWVGMDGVWYPGTDPETGLETMTTHTPGEAWRIAVRAENEGSFRASFGFGNIYPIPDGFKLMR